MKPITTKLTIGAMLATASLFVACSDSKVTDTDEQANTMNAQNVDPDFLAWLESDTLKSSPECQDTTIHEDLPAGIMTEFGELVRVNKTNFESIYCKQRDTWLVYSVAVSDTSVDKYLTIPDTLLSEFFIQDCEEEGGSIQKKEPSIQGITQLTCTIASKLDSVMAPGSMQYFDRNWEKYAQQIIDICGEPIEVDPLDIESPQVEIREDDFKRMKAEERSLAKTNFTE